MKITKSRMKQIIKEEIQKALTEQDKKFFPTKKKCRYPRMPKLKGAFPFPEFLKKNRGEGFKDEPQYVFAVEDETGKEFGNRLTNSEFYYLWRDKYGCAIPIGYSVYRLYQREALGKWKEIKIRKATQPRNLPKSIKEGKQFSIYWQNVTSLFEIQKEEPEEDEQIEEPEIPSEEYTFSDEEGTLAGGGGPGGCGPKPPLSKNWREKAWASSERKTFRAWIKCVRNAKSK